MSSGSLSGWGRFTWDLFCQGLAVLLVVLVLLYFFPPPGWLSETRGAKPRQGLALRRDAPQTHAGMHLVREASGGGAFTRVGTWYRGVRSSGGLPAGQRGGERLSRHSFPQPPALAGSGRTHAASRAAGSSSLWPNPRSGWLQGQMERQRPGCRVAAAVLAGPLLSSFLQAARVRAQQGSLAAENGSWAAEEAQGNESSEHAFFSLDYQHVQVPFEITLWIMLASLAKIGKASREGEERCLTCSAGWPGDSSGAGRCQSFPKSPL